LAGDRLETGRFAIGADFAPASNIPQGGHVLAEGLSGTGSVTLSAGLNTAAEGKAATVGMLSREQVDYADPGPFMRVTYQGYGVWAGSSKTAGNPWLDALFHSGSNSVFTRSTATDHSGQNAMRLNITADGDTDTARLQPGYMLGSLCFRR
jgi:hypothetical protein